MPPSFLRLSEIWTYASVTMMKIYCMSMTSILWYDLREYVCYCECGACVFSPLLIWPCSAIYFDYMPCLPHDLPTANCHDHAWTETWAQNICMLRKLLSLMRPWYAHWKDASRNQLCGTEGKWINCPTCSALLDVGFMIVLRRAGR